MYSSALMAFLHHAAAFTLVGALAVEVALFKPPLSVAQAQRLLRTDNLYGAAAGVLLVAGLLRVTYFEKGPAYYWHDAFFLIKFGAFLIAALISVYPTLIFLSWNRGLKAGTAPEIPAARVRSVRTCLMLELTAILVILLCAALMARGFGYRADSSAPHEISPATRGKPVRFNSREISWGTRRSANLTAANPLS